MPTEVAAGIWRLVLPTPYRVGPVNAYLIDDDPLTLVDTGQRDDGARRALAAEPAGVGRRVEDLERIVLSHQHIDHWGLAGELAQRSGAEVCALAPFADWLARFPASMHDEEEFTLALLARHGVRPTPPSVYAADFARGAPVAVDRPLHDGDALAFAGRTLRVLHRPGHSASDTVLFDESGGVMLGADHLMARPSTAVLAPPLSGGPARTRPPGLAALLRSLRRTAALAPELVLPGHGDVVTDAAATAARHRRRWERMTERVGAALDERPRTATEIAREVRGRAVDLAPFFVLCDTLGCLDLLIAGGEAVETTTGERSWFARA